MNTGLKTEMNDLVNASFDPLKKAMSDFGNKVSHIGERMGTRSALRLSDCQQTDSPLSNVRGVVAQMTREFDHHQTLGRSYCPYTW